MNNVTVAYSTRVSNSYNLNIICRGDPMQMFAQFFGGNDPFSTFFASGSTGGGPQLFFSTGGDDMHFGIALFLVLGH